MKEFFKSGIQSEEDPFEFVMSTDAVDRMGDIVEQDWSLSDFKKNPIALWMHDHESPIGVWRDVRKTDNGLVGRLKLAAQGTSELIDTIRSLLEQRILRAVSVGFRSNKYEQLDEKDPWGGYRLSDNELMECSLVSVPANQEALATTKSLSETIRARLFTEKGNNDPAFTPIAKQLGKRSRDSDPVTESKFKRKEKMSLSDKIETKQTGITDLKNQLSTLVESLDNESFTDEQNAQIEELSAKIETTEEQLGILQKAETALVVRASTQAKTKKPDNPATPHIEVKPNRPKGHKAFAAIAVMVKSHQDRSNPFELAKMVFPEEPEIETVIRAATDPATVADAAWAGPLVRETWGEFLELIRDISVYPRLPGMKLDFDSYGKITLPKNVGRGQLSGAFVGEGAAIPVKEGAYGGIDLTPKKMAVISTFTREIGMHSMPSIQGLLQTQMLEDTAETLDTLYLDATARDTVRPAGLQDTTETGADNINAASGTTVATIIADTQAMIGRLIAARAGAGAVWLMNPLQVLALRNKQDAASGEFVFRAEVAAGTFQGFPVVVSQNVTAGIVVLQGNNAVAYANDYAPQVDVSDQATIVFDDTAPDDVYPPTNTQPTKSMFQTDSIAVKLRVGLDWRIIRIGGVQVLTGVAW